MTWDNHRHRQSRAEFISHMTFRRASCEIAHVISSIHIWFDLGYRLKLVLNGTPDLCLMFYSFWAGFCLHKIFLHVQKREMPSRGNMVFSYGHGMLLFLWNRTWAEVSPVDYYVSDKTRKPECYEVLHCDCTYRANLLPHTHVWIYVETFNAWPVSRAYIRDHISVYKISFTFLVSEMHQIEKC